MHANWVVDWLLDGVADVCAEAGGGELDWGTNGQGEDR